ncbi:MAG: amino acid ABC transporter ATP-binding protein [Pirellulales bacterium]
MSQDAPAVAVRSLQKRYAEGLILDGISLSVTRGEVCGIIGPSGGGKTTFLRCLNGLEDFQGGELDVAGVTLRAGMPPRERQSLLARIRRSVGMVFQQFNLFPHRTALGNVIEAPIHVLGVAREQAIDEARVLLDRVGLGDKLNHMPDMLSGGQQQRVAIARALAMKPEVMLFDEPTSALDPRMAAEVEAVIAEVAASGQTMIVVTHSLRLARRTARTLHVFEAGRVLESGPAAEVFENPREEATRRFLDEAHQK